jgi:Golgi nucleoside diphosphatase
VALFVPSQASTPVSLKATAGLRLLPGDKADHILDAVTALLRTYPFQLPEAGGVAIMDGVLLCCMGLRQSVNWGMVVL